MTKLTPEQAQVVFSLRLRNIPPQTWSAIGMELNLSPYAMRHARQSREYLDMAFDYLARHGFSTHETMLRHVGCLHPGVSDMPVLEANNSRFAAERSGHVIFDDGGRASWEKQNCEGAFGDCVPRAIAIAMDADYGDVRCLLEAQQRLIRNNYSVDKGTLVSVSDGFFMRHGWRRLDLRKSVPFYAFDIAQRLGRALAGRGAVLAVRGESVVSGHFVAAKNGQLHDTWDSAFKIVESIWVPATEKAAVILELGAWIYARCKG